MIKSEYLKCTTSICSSAQHRLSKTPHQRCLSSATPLSCSQHTALVLFFFTVFFVTYTNTKKVYSQPSAEHLSQFTCSKTLTLLGLLSGLSQKCSITGFSYTVCYMSKIIFKWAFICYLLQYCVSLHGDPGDTPPVDACTQFIFKVAVLQIRFMIIQRLDILLGNETVCLDIVSTQSLYYFLY